VTIVVEDPETPFVAVVDLHILQEPVIVSAVKGDAHRVTSDGNLGDRLEIGATLELGQIIFVGPEGQVTAGMMNLVGRRRGCAHSFVELSAVTASPGRKDVPHLIRDLAELEKQVVSTLGTDPLEMQEAPSSGYDRAYAVDYALQNLDIQCARQLPETEARELNAVCLFLAGESACVAVSGLSVRRLRSLMEALGRPVNPHMVDEETLRTLLATVYGAAAKA
jgi:hypothetical protein